ncbi:uncharacterized protein TNIN_97641 [Trichonephila inaurata madagascariensis]|uniref:LolA-like domain-containing protein n=1 Tax=Trichonephila inaurata madagascariensis TaxID=2747483 RepID=A0A8X6Y799_9ARAC|nr:uncharacterized protein TNIN_97641 [Trichonephila inaurata madagascariensis]
MATVWWSALLLALSVQIARSDYDADVCSFYKDSYGLIPPALPRNFELKGDHVDYMQKYATYQEMHFDFSNSRAKYMYLLNGIERHLLFDYEARQVIEYDVFHPGMDIKDDPLSRGCTATDLDDSEHKYVFGFLDEYSDWPKMYDQYQVMRFGGQYKYAYNGTNRMSERGLLVDKFVGCIYDQEMSATIAANYSFTNRIVFTSGGTMTEDVLGVDDGMLSVAARLDMYGTVYDDVAQQRQTLNKSENTFWFRGEPDFALDTFRIPPYMFCENFRGRKILDDFPEAFSTRVQKTTIQRDTLGNLATSEVTSFEEIYYYKDKNLARRDHTPDPQYDLDIYYKFLSYEPVRSIYDFNTGVMYVTNIPTGKCYYRSIIPGDYFDASKQHMYIKMADPNEVFRMEHEEMEFKGSDFARDIECDVWSGKHFDEIYNATFITETYVSTNGWHEESDELLEYGVPVKHSILTQELSNELVENLTTYHFLKFKKTPPRLISFDISNCIETIDHKALAILLTLSTSERSTIFKYRMQFLESAQYYLTEITEVFTPLRIQRLRLRQLSQSDIRTLLVFTLVGKPKLRTQTPVGQPGASLEEAFNKLQGFINRNQFAIKFIPPQAKESLTIKALRGSLYVRTADGDLKAPTADVTTPPTIVRADNTSEEEEEEKKGMSPGECYPIKSRLEV